MAPPLIDIRVRRLEKYWLIEGFDPIDNHRCTFITTIDLSEIRPTYIRVKEPQRIVCDIEQAVVDECDELKVARGKGWFGTESSDEACVAKAAQRGDTNAMRQYAWNRSYRYLGRDNDIRAFSS
jgi:hypothetical protein